VGVGPRCSHVDHPGYPAIQSREYMVHSFLIPFYLTLPRCYIEREITNRYTSVGGYGLSSQRARFFRTLKLPQREIRCINQ
jgi:hypothetical protein